MAGPPQKLAHTHFGHHSKLCLTGKRDSKHYLPFIKIFFFIHIFSNRGWKLPNCMAAQKERLAFLQIA
jgi:hypothetical protein